MGFFQDKQDLLNILSQLKIHLETPEQNDQDPGSELAKVSGEAYRRLSNFVCHYYQTQEVMASLLLVGREFFDPIHKDRSILVKGYPDYEAVVLESDTRKRGTHWKCHPAAKLRAIIIP